MKAILNLAIFLLIFGNLYSQKQISVTVGSNYTVPTQNNVSGGFGFHASAGITFPINNRISVKTGLGVKQLSYKIRTQNIEMKDSSSNVTKMHEYWGKDGYDLSNSFSSNYKMYVMAIPVQMQVKFFKNKLLLSSGMSVHTLVYSRNKYFLNYAIRDDVANKDFKTFFLNANIEAKYRVYKNLYAGFSYERNLTKVMKDYNQLYLNNFSIDISYLF